MTSLQTRGSTDVSVVLHVNGRKRLLQLDSRVTLLDALREHLGLIGTKKGCDQGQCDREVEPRAFLPQCRRCEVDRDPLAHGPAELGGGDPAPDAFLRLLAGFVREADDREGGQAALDVCFDLDPAWIDADERVSDCPCEHVATLGDEM